MDCPLFSLSLTASDVADAANRTDQFRTSLKIQLQCLSLAPTLGMFENAAKEDVLPNLQSSTNLKISNWACIIQLAICYLHTASEMLLSYFIRGCTMVVKRSRGPVCSLLQFCWAGGRPIPRNIIRVDRTGSGRKKGRTIVSIWY